MWWLQFRPKPEKLFNLFVLRTIFYINVVNILAFYYVQYRKQFNVSPFLEGSFEKSYWWWSRQQLLKIKKKCKISTSDLVSIDILGSKSFSMMWLLLIHHNYLAFSPCNKRNILWHNQDMLPKISNFTNISFSTNHYNYMGIGLGGLL